MGLVGQRRAGGQAEKAWAGPRCGTHDRRAVHRAAALHVHLGTLAARRRQTEQALGHRAVRYEVAVPAEVGATALEHVGAARLRVHGQGSAAEWLGGRRWGRASSPYFLLIVCMERLDT